VGFQTRTACEMLGRILSLQIEAKETHAIADRRLKLRENIVQMLSLMADRERGSVAEGLLAAPDVLLGSPAPAVRPSSSPIAANCSAKRRRATTWKRWCAGWPRGRSARYSTPITSGATSPN